MLRQAGHRWAEEPHRHSAPCGHDRAERPAAQRPAVRHVLRAPGHRIDDRMREEMEARFGADFSDVRVHDDSAARASAADIGARAYTSGSHVVIGDGGDDKRTLAHELTHVVQQRHGSVAGSDNGSGLRLSDPADRFEREAEANAGRVMREAIPATADSGDEPRRRSGGAAPAEIQRMEAPDDPAVHPVPAAPAGPTVQQVDFEGAIALAGDNSTRRWRPPPLLSPPRCRMC
ncbi:DUF4157 domain-containing protein [Streptomyces sp. NPDC001279]|uniref:eCIS core domain-containing protein n=1 Tax=Streptomyces sp. NPDC001279 TaxID=3364556 RepID=UPI0036A3F046